MTSETRCKYTTSDGKAFDLLAEPYYIASLNTLFDYDWELVEVSNTITGYSRKGLYQKQIEVTVCSNSRAEVAQAAERLFSAFENDVTAGKHGRLYVGDYYMSCNVTGCAVKARLQNAKVYVLTITTDRRYWTKEIQTITFTDSSIILNSDSFEDTSLPFGVPFGFPNPNETKSFDNSAITPCNFRLHIFGPCVNPTINIAGNVYSVAVTLSEDDTLIIDSTAGTIVIRSQNADFNCFGNRDLEHDVFAKIPTGECTVTWNGIERFRLTLIEERSAPPCD